MLSIKLTEGKVFLYSLDLLSVSEIGRQKTNKVADRRFKCLEYKKEAEMSLSISCNDEVYEKFKREFIKIFISVRREINEGRVTKEIQLSAVTNTKWSLQWFPKNQTV